MQNTGTTAAQWQQQRAQKNIDDWREHCDRYMARRSLCVCVCVVRMSGANVKYLEYEISAILRDLSMLLFASLLHLSAAWCFFCTYTSNSAGVNICEAFNRWQILRASHCTTIAMKNKIRCLISNEQYVSQAQPATTTTMLIAKKKRPSKAGKYASDIKRLIEHSSFVEKNNNKEPGPSFAFHQSFQSRLNLRKMIYFYVRLRINLIEQPKLCSNGTGKDLCHTTKWAYPDEISWKVTQHISFAYKSLTRPLFAMRLLEMCSPNQKPNRISQTPWLLGRINSRTNACNHSIHT